MQHDVFEIATDANFNEDRYLTANPDLQKAKQSNKNFDAHRHFTQHGKHERRKQLTSAISSIMKVKYAKFETFLEAQEFVSAKESCFPIVSTQAIFDEADYDAVSANPTPGYWSAELERNPEGYYLDLGCGVRDVVYDNCLYVEVFPSPTADIIMSPNTRLPVADGSLDGLCCLTVLEHVENPFFVAAEIKRVVKPGGHIFIDWPFLQPVHGYPSHYYNATLMGLRRMFEDAFEIEELKPFHYQGADYTLSWVLNWFIDGVRTGPVREQLLSMTVAELAALKPPNEFYRNCLDSMDPDMKTKLACGNTLIAKRRPNSAMYAPPPKEPRKTTKISGSFARR